MRVLWMGMNDEGGCVLHWHRLREHLRDEYGVELCGPGYSWDTGPRILSDILREAGKIDWLVLDDANAKGYLPVKVDCVPDAKFAWREHDWHNRRRQAVATVMKPDLIFGCADRPSGEDPFRESPNWHYVPHPVDMDTFHPNGTRDIDVALYGSTAKVYPNRQRAKRVLMERKARGESVWLPVHGGYWKNGHEHNDGITTFYNENLAKMLARVKCCFVSGGHWKGCVLKYFEAAASGCLMVGIPPHPSTIPFPYKWLVQTPPEEIDEVVDYALANEEERKEITEECLEHLREHHSIPARARQIMELLHAH